MKVLWEMDALAPFRIPVTGLKAEHATYHWDIDPDFLRLFDDEHEVENGHFQVMMNLDHVSNITTLNFQISGRINTLCDRCLVAIELPITGEYEIIVKFGDPSQTTDEVIFVDPESSGLNLGQHIYDFILLSVPIRRKIPDCESMIDRPCDMTVLAYLSEKPDHKNGSGGDDDSPWTDLKKVIDN